MDTLKKYNIHLKSLSPLIMHSDKGCNPFHPLAKKMKEISAIKNKKEDHFLGMARIEFELGLYYEESIGIHLPAKVLMGCFKAAARKSKKGKETRGITIDCAIGVPLIGYEKYSPESLWAEKNKNGEQKFAFTEPVKVMRAKIMRTRPIFPTWEVNFDLYLDTECFNPHELESLIRTAGFECGVCELRPEKATGSYGRFTLESMKEVK